MAEVKISPTEIRDALAKHVAAYKPSAAVKDEIGSVTEAGDGIARVEGLPSTMTNELLKFENGTLGLALNLWHTRTSAELRCSRNRCSYFG